MGVLHAALGLRKPELQLSGGPAGTVLLLAGLGAVWETDAGPVGCAQGLSCV